jgi:hypothetical protein
VRYHPWVLEDLTPTRETGRETVSAGQFYWGGILPKSNGGARRWAQHGLQPCVECIGISPPNCEAYKPSRDESRPK